MPLTVNGYEEYDFNTELIELKRSYQQYMKQAGQQDVDVSDGSPAGQFIAWVCHLVVQADKDAHDVNDNGYAVTASGVGLDYKGADSALQRNPAQNSVATLDITGQPGYLINANTKFSTEDGTVFVNSKDTQIGQDGTCQLTVYSQEQAAYTNVNANTITVQDEPVDEISTVNNPNPATGGADLESDYDFRKRILPNQYAQEGPSDDGLTAGLLNVDGVQDATVSSNVSDSTNEQGDPPHTTHVYVEGGRPQDIANKLLSIAGGETTFVGNQKVNAIDDSGHAVEIRYDTQEKVIINIKVNIQGSNIDTDAIKQSIMDSLTSQHMGEPLMLNKLFGPIYNNEGVQNINNISASLNGNNITDTVNVSKYQTIATDDDHIEVKVNE